MKKILLSIFCLINFGLFAQISDTLIAPSHITDVTVFFSGAQVSREVNYHSIKILHITNIIKYPSYARLYID